MRVRLNHWVPQLTCTLLSSAFFIQSTHTAYPQHNEPMSPCSRPTRASEVWLTLEEEEAGSLYTTFSTTFVWTSLTSTFSKSSRNKEHVDFHFFKSDDGDAKSKFSSCRVSSRWCHIMSRVMVRSQDPRGQLRNHVTG